MEFGEDSKLPCGHSIHELVYACRECSIPERWMTADMKADRDALIGLSTFLEERNIRTSESSVQSAMDAIADLERRLAEAKEDYELLVDLTSKTAATRDRLREALEFYGSSLNWQSYRPPEAYLDNGTLARLALGEGSKQEEESR